MVGEVGVAWISHLQDHQNENSIGRKHGSDTLLVVVRPINMERALAEDQTRCLLLHGPAS
jgi:hypothetical protein